MFDITLNECFKYSFIIVSSSEDLLFFNFFNDFWISSAVIQQKIYVMIQVSLNHGLMMSVGKQGSNLDVRNENLSEIHKINKPKCVEKNVVSFESSLLKPPSQLEPYLVEMFIEWSLKKFILLLIGS
jgi:hypothetical protein